MFDVVDSGHPPSPARINTLAGVSRTTRAVSFRPRQMKRATLSSIVCVVVVFFKRVINYPY